MVWAEVMSKSGKFQNRGGGGGVPKTYQILGIPVDKAIRAANRYVPGGRLPANRRLVAIKIAGPIPKLK